MSKLYLEADIRMQDLPVFRVSLVRQEVILPPTKDVKSVPRRFWYGEAEENSK